MNSTRTGFQPGRLTIAAGLAWLILSGSGQAASRTGEALIVAQTGKASARVFTGPVHEGRTTVKELFEGASLSEQSRIMTGRDGRLCTVFSPGAILCVAPRTELTIEQLRHTADGLPKSEEDLVRRIHLQLHRGRIRIQAGTPIPTMDIRITTPDGVVEAQGGAFVVGQDEQKRWTVLNDAFELAVTPRNGRRVEMEADTSARIEMGAGDQGRLRVDGVDRDPSLEHFELCNTFFADLEPFLHHTRQFDRGGLEQYMGLGGSFVSLDDGSIVTDVSPTTRPDVGIALTPSVPASAGGEPGGRWDVRRIWTWYDSVGTVKGANYIPRTAVNSVDMWMEDSFDPDIIEEELAWAENIGYTCIRVQLQFVVWQQDPEGFLERVDRLLEIASRQGMRVTLVLFDDLNLAGQPPRVGKQPEPIPGVHNARWVPSPASKAVTDRGQWPALEQYVKDVMARFRRDGRILYWDLYNTAGNNGLNEDTLPLLDQTFNWARSVDAAQPLAVAPWREFNSAMAARKLERSDIITFQSFDNVESLEARLLLLQRYQRPIICSDWLMRQTGNDFEQVLPLFSIYQVGWFNAGLVSGKTQKQVQQAQVRSESDPDLWQQDVLHEDGTPYNPKEVELIQGFRYLETP